MSNKQFSKTIGNINNLSNFTCDSATINNLTANNVVTPNSVTAAANMPYNYLIADDDGLKRNHNNAVIGDDCIL